jgi:hypothetical protein
MAGSFWEAPSEPVVVCVVVAQDSLAPSDNQPNPHQLPCWSWHEGIAGLRPRDHSERAENGELGAVNRPTVCI